jgi:16S rRNA (guanine527-N7)-methyltransferase
MRVSELIQNGCAELGIALPEAAPRQFEAYYAFLREQNALMNLTAISGEEDTANLHFLDSLAVLRAADFADKSVIDIGSGAGFPGIPLKLAEPSIELNLIDSNEKRVLFLTELCEKLGLDDVESLDERAETAGQSALLREGYDIAVARAVAELRVLCELCLPFVSVGGRFIAMKSSDAEEETAAAKTAIAALGGELSDIRDYQIPGTGITHRLLIIEKTARTPAAYPRRFAAIQKKPL